MMEKAYFRIDASCEYYEGYHNSNIFWNGWAVPYFVKEIADKIKDIVSTENYLEIIYDKDKDCYICTLYQNGEIEEEYVFEKEIINTPEGKKEVYAIGAGYWTWDSYTPEEVKEDKDVVVIRSDTISKDDIKEY